MSAPHEHDDELARDPELARALEALPPVVADAAFEARLRARFLQGGSGQDTQEAPPTPSRRRLVLLPALALAAAAAVITVFLVATPDPAPAWEVLPTSRGDVIHVDDRPYSLSRPDELRSALARGAQVRTAAGTRLHLGLGSQFALEIGAQSEVRLPRPPRVEVRPLTLSALYGHLSVVTGPEFAGNRLLVRAPEVEVEVVGTRFAVDVGEDGTCVCCTQGTVEVRSLVRPEQAGPVGADAMALGMPDGSLKFAPMIVPEHVEPLEELAGSLR